jgi:5-formyltetrahydrofolate cyclo-ligase
LVGARRLEDGVSRIEARVRSLERFRIAELIAVYAALPGEVDTWGLLAELWTANRSVVLPRIESRRLILHRVSCTADLVPGSQGVLEPRGALPAVEPERVDLFLVPGLYFDRSGNRLGRGWGCYDRLLAAARPDAERVGLCFGDQLLDQVPVAPWDQPMDRVITDREGILSSRTRSSETR